MATGPTRRKRNFGKFMRELRIRRRPDLKPEQVAELAECKRPTVSRMETGTSLPGRHLFRVILDIYEPTEAERAKALRLWDHADAEVAVIQHSESHKQSYLAFRHDESDAVWEKNFQPTAVPGIAQVDRYVAALTLKGGGASSAEHAAERRARRNQLYPPRSLVLHMLLDESVIRKVVGGSDVMIEQLQHLLELGKLPNVTLQVIPDSAGSYGLMTGSVVLLGFDDDGEESSSAYLESHLSSQTVENETDVQSLAELFDEGCSVALSPENSAEMVKRQIEVHEGGV